jgi:hypothetical protein
VNRKVYENEFLKRGDYPELTPTPSLLRREIPYENDFLKRGEI